MKKILTSLLSVTFIFVICLFSGCSGDSTDPLAVSSLKISDVAVSSSSNTAASAPVTYKATITWDTSEIMADQTASAALSGLKVSIQDGTTELFTADIATDVTTYEFDYELLPGDSVDLRVTSVYAAGTYGSDSEYDSARFVGGPWYDGTNAEKPSIERFSVGSFNHADGMPSGYYTFSDYYYFNPFNTDYLFEAVGDVKWWIVDVHEVTASNDTDTQRNNVQWLVNNFRLLDDSTTTDDTDMAAVDLTIYDIDGDTLYTINGSATGGAMSSTNFSSLLSSVDTGYYSDKTGYFYIKSTCRSMPSSYDSNDNPDNLGFWGFGIMGSRR